MRPAFRVTVNRKDGEEITFTDYKGEKQTKKYCPIGVLFPNKTGTGFNLKLDKKTTLDPDVVWIAVYPVEDRDDEDERPARKKSAAKKAEPREDEESESSDDELNF